MARLRSDRARGLYVLAMLGGLTIVRSAEANGRMPGASQLRSGAVDGDQLLVQATFGLLQSADRGQSWQWICEEVISTAGVIADPPMTTSQDGSIVLLPPIGSPLISHNGGCDWAQAVGHLADARAVDVTLDVTNSARILVLLSTVAELTPAGFASFDNLLVESRDNAHTWSVVSQLPADIALETVEIAASDPGRIYLSGTSNEKPSLGIVLCSEDGGKQWSRHTVELPQGRGSMLISAIDPMDADRLWARVPARGDINGTLPASLFMSDNKGADWRLIASTKRGMFGFALSPNGRELAYGGPGDGLFVGPSDGSAFEQVNMLTVMCLRWTTDTELYACASEPPDMFSLGRSADKGRTFEPLFRLGDTCPKACPESSNAGLLCASSWSRVAQLVRASGEMCALPEGQTAPIPTSHLPDASLTLPDAKATAVDPKAQATSGCTVTHAAGSSSIAWLLALLALAWPHSSEIVSSIPA